MMNGASLPPATGVGSLSTSEPAVLFVLAVASGAPGVITMFGGAASLVCVACVIPGAVSVADHVSSPVGIGWNT